MPVSVKQQLATFSCTFRDQSPMNTTLLKALVALLKGWVLSFAGWGMVAFILGARISFETEGPWTMGIRPGIRDWLPWAFLTPLIFQFVIRFPIDRDTWKTRGPLHLVCCVVVIALCQKWQGFYDPLFRPAPMLPPPPPGILEDRLPPPGVEGPRPHRGPPRGPSRSWVDLFHLVTFGLPIYLMIVSGAHAAVFFRRDQQRAAKLAEARLGALRSQLQPHFLFNTLNVIAELVHHDAEKADAMITALSDMLRITLDSKPEQLVPLARETEFLGQYIAIMQIRLGDRLQYTYDIEPAADAALVPPFFLQPLVENAILHGIEPKAGGGTVTIRGWIAENKLHVTVADDGAGMETPLTREGVGLSNTRARLQELFAGDVVVKLTNGKGVTVEVIIPFRSDERTAHSHC